MQNIDQLLCKGKKGFLFLFSKAKEAFMKRVNLVTLMEAGEGEVWWF